jgi:hypothetical protein
MYIIYKLTDRKKYVIKYYHDPSGQLILVMVPIGGKRNGCEIYNQKVTLLLQKAKISHRIQVTNDHSHGYHIAKTV